MAALLAITLATGALALIVTGIVHFALAGLRRGSVRRHLELGSLLFFLGWLAGIAFLIIRARL